MDEIEKCFRERWDEFVKRISRRCVNVADAEDVVSEAFKRAIQYKDTYNPEKQAIHVWLYMIVTNAYHDYISDLFKRGMSVSVSDEHVPGYEQDFENIDMACKIMEKIDGMTPGPVRDCLAMYYGLGMTPREIAMVSPVDAKFVRNNVYRFKEYIIKTLGLEEWVANKDRVAN